MYVSLFIPASKSTPLIPQWFHHSQATLPGRIHEMSFMRDGAASLYWRYAGFIPTRFSGEGGMKEIDLIFEKPVEE